MLNCYRMQNHQLYIEPIPAFDDNYIWLLHNTRDAIVIDPGDAGPVLAELNIKKLKLKAILITHHHADHTLGVNKLLEEYPAIVYAPKYEQFRFNHIAISEGDVIELPTLNLRFNVMWLPGHTLGHIAYVNDNQLFCGDVLFGAGCGRIFEGSPKQMLHSLNRLKKLNPLIQVFCTHEYTAKNIDFALSLEPDNQMLINRKHHVSLQRENNQPSLPSTIQLELDTNPFLRCQQPTIVQKVDSNHSDELSVFTKIRFLRNHY